MLVCPGALSREGREFVLSCHVLAMQLVVTSVLKSWFWKESMLIQLIKYKLRLVCVRLASLAVIGLFWLILIVLI